MINVKSICSVAVLMFMVCFFCGCTTMINQPTRYDKDALKEYKYIEKGEYVDAIPYTLRDFVVKGIIFVESRVTIDVNGERTGSEITNYMLMKEAQKLGADDVINVRIDEKEESKVVDSYDEDVTFIERDYKKTSYVYQATALAIKYTNAIIIDKDSVKINVNAQKGKGVKEEGPKVENQEQDSLMKNIKKIKK